MFSFFIFLVAVLSFFFPYFLIKEITLTEKDAKRGFFVLGACISFGLIFIVLESSLMQMY